MEKDIELNKDTKETILLIEEHFKKIQNEQNTTSALDYLQEIIDYLRKTYYVK